MDQSCLSGEFFVNSRGDGRGGENDTEPRLRPPGLCVCVCVVKEREKWEISYEFLITIIS